MYVRVCISQFSAVSWEFWMARKGHSLFILSSARKCQGQKTNENISICEACRLPWRRFQPGAGRPVVPWPLCSLLAGSSGAPAEPAFSPPAQRTRLSQVSCLGGGDAVRVRRRKSQARLAIMRGFIYCSPYRCCRASLSTHFQDPSSLRIVRVDDFPYHNDIIRRG